MALVLIVEDDHALCEIYRRILERAGVETLVAADGVAAVELLEDYTPDVIFLDILLPRMSGLEVLKYIASCSHLKSTHVVIVTANPRFEQEARAIHPIDFLAKPVQASEIRAAVANART